MAAERYAAGEEQITVTRCRICKGKLLNLPSQKRGLCHPCKPIVDAAIAARGC
jgi:hypothetical protein